MFDINRCYFIICTLQEKVEDVGMMKLMQQNKPEWHFIFFGCINSIIHGGIQPILAILLGSVLGVSFQLVITNDSIARLINRMK